MKQLIPAWINAIKQFFSRKNDEQAVLIHLDGASLPEEVYEENDISTLSELLEDALEGTNAGMLDGEEFSAEGVTLYLYGNDAEKLFETIKPVLLTYPLCKAGYITIRKGNPEITGTNIPLPLRY